MKYQLTIRDEAELDISACFAHYETIRLGLGHDFLLCIEEGLAKIQRNPLIYKVIYRNLRRMPIRRFPYRIFFLISANTIVITAVFHAQKNPQSWGQRL